MEDIYCARFAGGTYEHPQRLGTAINSGNLSETTPFVSPDERYLIHRSM